MTPSQATLHRAAKRRSQVVASVNVWPLLVLQIILLCSFAIYSPPSHGGVPLDYPKGPHALPQSAARRENAMRIMITRDGKVFFRQRTVSVDELAERITAAVHDGAENKIYLAADSRVKLRDVNTVLDLARAAGVMRVAILTDR